MVISIDKSVLVQIHILDITRANFCCKSLFRNTIFQNSVLHIFKIIFCKQTVVDIAENLPYRMTGFSTSCSNGSQRFIFVDDFIMGISEATHQTDKEIFADLLVDIQRYFRSLILHFTTVAPWVPIETGGSRNRVQLYKDVVTAFVEKIYLKVYHTIEQTQFQANVGFVYNFPSQVRNTEVALYHVITSIISVQPPTV